MQCPSCQSNMTELTYEGVRIDRCDTCDGVWLDKGELTVIVRTFVADVSTVALNPERGTPKVEALVTCPKCPAAMEKFEYAGTSGVILDKCPEHGIWFDKGELEEIQFWYEQWQSATNSPPSDYEQRKAVSETESGVSEDLPQHYAAFLQFLKREQGGV